jgi:hypothetical protein
MLVRAAVGQLRAEGRTVNDEDIARLWPARYEHINPYGQYRFEVEKMLRIARNGTENRNKIVIRRVFPGLPGRNQAVLPGSPPEPDV